MRSLREMIGRGTRNQSVGLLTIGGSMLICSTLAEAGIKGAVAREIVQALVIAAGLGAITILFRGRGGHRR